MMSNLYDRNLNYKVRKLNQLFIDCWVIEIMKELTEISKQCWEVIKKDFDENVEKQEGYKRFKKHPLYREKFVQDILSKYKKLKGEILNMSFEELQVYLNEDKQKTKIVGVSW